MQHQVNEDEVIRDLDEFFAEDLAAAGTSGTTDLDSLLEESMAAVKEEREMKASRKLLARGNLDSKEKEYIEGKVREWELARVWEVAASTIYFEVQMCECGADHKHFRGYFQRQHHRTSAIDRWVAVDKGQIAAAPLLPKEIKEDIVVVAICEDCCGLQGWAK